MCHLPGIRSQLVDTAKIESHVLSCGEDHSEAIVLLHGNLSSATYFEELMLSLSGDYYCVAPDMRGYGSTQDLPIDATRGAKDWSDDLKALLDALELESAHLLGWSAGAAAIMQFALDYPSLVRSLSLVAPVSPYGFGGTYGVDGSPIHSDFAGSGAGIVNAEVEQQLQSGNTSDDSPAAPLSLLREYFVKPPLRLRREAMLVNGTLQQKTGSKRYPGDYVSSPNWPHVAPGEWGPTNALSPKYFNVTGLTKLRDKPPVLWVRGDSDQIVADDSLFDAAAMVSAESGIDYPAQPMVAQMREMLSDYEANGGTIQEVEFRNTGHSPFIEKPKEFSELMLSFLGGDHDSSQSRIHTASSSTKA